MKVKVCFNNEIHVIPRIPDTLTAFTNLLKSTFHSKLPNAWALQYTDSDGDNILMNDEKDYEEFTNPDPVTSTKVPKVYIVSIESFRPVEEPVEVEDTSVIENKEEDDYQIIKNEDPVLEEVLNKEEEPVVQEITELKKACEDVEDKWDVKEENREVEETKEKEPVQTEVKESNKVLVNLNDLTDMISRLIDSKLPQMAESIKNQLPSQDISLCESMVAYAGVNVLPEEPPKKKTSVSLVKHFGISCSGCKVMPIVGIRYRCPVCPRFDYCENCEETCEHDHDLVKMKQRDLLDIFRPNPQVVIPLKPEVNPFVERVQEKEKKSKKERREEKRVSKTYFTDLKRKAKKLQKCFPKEDFDILCCYVNGAPEDMTLEELVENFKH